MGYILFNLYVSIAIFAKLKVGTTLLQILKTCIIYILYKEVQVGKDQEKAQSKKDSHSKNRGGKKPK